jgi:hypothetical protein
MFSCALEKALNNKNVMTRERALVSLAMLLYLAAGMCILRTFDGNGVSFAMIGLLLGTAGGRIAVRFSGPPRQPMMRRDPS